MATMNRTRLKSTFAGLLTVAIGTGCSPSEPSAENITWSVERAPNKKTYRVTASADVVKGFGGFYFPIITLVDDRGCHKEFGLKSFDDFKEGANHRARATFSDDVDLARPVGTAEFALRYDQLTEGSLNPSDVIHTSLFSEERIINPSIKVPEMAASACGKSSKQIEADRRARLRERAKTDSDGADAEAISGMSRNEVVATAINSAGFLCAKVTDLYPSGRDMIVSCPEYRNGSGKARYRVNAAEGSVRQM